MAKTLTTLVKEVNALRHYAEVTAPKEVARTWLLTSQNAFLFGKDPDTERNWADRHGKAFGKGFTKTGNVERYLNYKKLHRTGKLLRSLKASARGRQIVLSSSSPYAKIHNEGGHDKSKKVSGSYVRGDVKAVAFGGNIVARPFMNPSKQVRRLLFTLVLKRMRKYGW